MKRSGSGNSVSKKDISDEESKRASTRGVYLWKKKKREKRIMVVAPITLRKTGDVFDLILPKMNVGNILSFRRNRISIAEVGLSSY